MEKEEVQLFLRTNLAKGGLQMNNRKTRAQAKKILEDALEKILQLDVDFNIVCSTMFFDKNKEVTDESRWYCFGSENNDEAFKVHAECLLKQINDKIENLRKTNKQKTNFKFLSLFASNENPREC